MPTHPLVKAIEDMIDEKITKLLAKEKQESPVAVEQTSVVVERTEAESEALSPAEFLNKVKAIVESSDLPAPQAKALAREALEELLGLKKFTDVPEDKQVEVLKHIESVV